MPKDNAALAVKPFPAAEAAKQSIKTKVTSPKKAPLARSGVISGRVSKTWPSNVGKPKFKGLQNPHNYCYRRSLLQTLFSAPQFFNVLQDSHQQCTKKGRCVTCALRQLNHSYHSATGKVSADLSALDRVIAQTGKKSDPAWRSNGRQEDSHEFLLYLLGTVDAARGVNKKAYDSLFRLPIRTSWKCGKCGNVSTRCDPPEFGATLSIPRKSGQITLTDCFNHYLQEEPLQIECEACKSKGLRKRLRRFDNGPELLLVHFNRFESKGRQTRKITRPIDYPEALDLSPWTVDSLPPQKYRLQAVVAHAGSLNTGHYVAYVRGPDGVRCISDSDVQNASPRELRSPGDSFDPYILMYMKE